MGGDPTAAVGSNTCLASVPCFSLGEVSHHQESFSFCLPKRQVFQNTRSPAVPRVSRGWLSDYSGSKESNVAVVIQLCPTLCDPKDCSVPDFLVPYYLPEFAQVHVHWTGDAIQPSHPSAALFSSCPQSFPASGSFPMSLLFASGGQSTGASASASVLLMSIQGWFPLRLTGLISLLFKDLSRVFSGTTIQKYQFFRA